MFKSIELVNVKYCNEGKYANIYRLNDSDFVCYFSCEDMISYKSISYNSISMFTASAAGVIKEYHERELDIIRNVYLFVKFLAGYMYKFMHVLNYLLNHIGEFLDIPNLSFKDDIYPGVKQMYETLDAFE